MENVKKEEIKRGKSQWTCLIVKQKYDLEC